MCLHVTCHHITWQDGNHQQKLIPTGTVYICVCVVVFLYKQGCIYTHISLVSLHVQSCTAPLNPSHPPTLHLYDSSNIPHLPKKCAQSFTTVSYQGTLALNSKIRSPISWTMQNGKCVYVDVYTCTSNNLHFLCVITEESSKARLPTTLCVHFVCVAADFIEVMLL